MDLVAQVALAGGLAWASGIRLYAVVFLAGWLGRLGFLALPEHLLVLQHPAVLGVAGVMGLAEFVADKVPAFDSLWDGVHTFIRIPAGAALAAAVMGDQGGALQVAMGLVGGTLAAGTHLAKAGARAAINTSPEPVSNVTTSLGEDVLFAGGMWALVHQPLLFLAGLAVFFIVALLLIWALWKFIKRVFRRPPRPLAGA